VIEFDGAALAGLTVPRTLTLAGSSVRTITASQVSTATFSPASNHSAEITTAFVRYDCFCGNPSNASFDGSVTLEAIEPRRLAGGVVVDSTADRHGAPQHSTPPS
jgi:hypothetical protein